MPFRRRAFSALALGAAAALGARADVALGKHSQFLHDLSSGFDQQIVGVDLADIELILRSMREPALGTATVCSAARAAEATAAALRDAGRLGSHSIVTVAFAPMRWRLADYKAVVTTARTQLDVDDGFQIYVPCADHRIVNSHTRVSVLTG